MICTNSSEKVDVEVDSHLSLSQNNNENGTIEVDTQSKCITDTSNDMENESNFGDDINTSLNTDTNTSNRTLTEGKEVVDVFIGYVAKDYPKLVRTKLENENAKPEQPYSYHHQLMTELDVCLHNRMGLFVERINQLRDDNESLSMNPECLTSEMSENIVKSSSTSDSTSIINSSSLPLNNNEIFSLPELMTVINSLPKRQEDSFEDDSDIDS
jgi:hypothetical protein